MLVFPHLSYLLLQYHCLSVAGVPNYKDLYPK
jgi:hypothetical protein